MLAEKVGGGSGGDSACSRANVSPARDHAMAYSKVDGSHHSNRAIEAVRQILLRHLGYRDYFIRHGVPADKILVTGIPNFDNCER
jgi:hypothetical protein